MVGQSLLGQPDIGEADHRMRPLPLRPGQAELAGEGDELALVVVLAGSGGVFDPADMGEAWMASWRMACRFWWEPSAGH